MTWALGLFALAGWTVATLIARATAYYYCELLSARSRISELEEGYRPALRLIRGGRA